MNAMKNSPFCIHTKTLSISSASHRVLLKEPNFHHNEIANSFEYASFIFESHFLMFWAAIAFIV